VIRFPNVQREIMAREDEEVSELVNESMRSDGVTIPDRHNAIRCEKKEGMFKRLIVEKDGVSKRDWFDALLCAVGRQARLERVRFRKA